VIGRDEENQARPSDSSRRTKNNPILFGMSPVWVKLRLWKRMAQRIVSGDVPENLKTKILVSSTWVCS